MIPTRERLDALTATLNSLLTCTRHLRQLEVLLVLDQDDACLEQTFALCDDYAMNLSCLVRPRTNGFFCQDYYNWGASKATGDNIMMFNDDACFVTQDWDVLAKEAIGTRQVYMLSFMDSTYHDGKLSYPKFPMVSRRAYEAVGYFFHPKIRMWGADNWLFCVHKEAGTIIDCHNVHIMHDHIQSEQFSEWFKINELEMKFPIDINFEAERLLEARGKYDRTRT